MLAQLEPDRQVLLPAAQLGELLGWQV